MPVAAPPPKKQKLVIPNFGIPKFDEFGFTLLQRHMWCGRWNKGKGSFYHRREVVRILWPKFELHRWFDRQLEGFCESDWLTWAGPGGSTKSTGAAVLSLVYWLEAPHETAVIVCSTSMKMLRMRIWNEITRHYMTLPAGVLPPDRGIMQNTEVKIIWKRGDDKHGFTGVAVEEGPVEQIVHNHLGVHTVRVLLVMDEMQGIRPAILKAAESNMSKNPEFKLLGLGNPENMDDLHGSESAPVDGYTSISPETHETWRTWGMDPVKGGRCDFFHGRKSPANDSPEEKKRLFFLTNNEQIDKHLYRLHGNANDPRFWSQSIGFWPPAGTEGTVLDIPIIEKFHCRENAVWTHGYKRWAALDPAFVEGGDKKVLRFGRFGEVEFNGKSRWVIQLDESVEVPIDAFSSAPVEYQIVHFCKNACGLKGIRPEYFGTDSSGIGRGLKSIFEREWGPVIGVEFGGSPSELPVDESNDQTCKEAYNNRSTELNMAVRAFAQGDGLRGLNGDAETQFCARKTSFKSKKTIVESKKDMKARISRSPDDADAVAIGIEVCRVHGATPSTDGVASVSTAQDVVFADYVRQSNEEYDPANYLNDYSWTPEGYEG